MKEPAATHIEEVADHATDETIPSVFLAGLGYRAFPEAEAVHDIPS
jgi:hypothetical protein